MKLNVKTYVSISIVILLLTLLGWWFNGKLSYYKKKNQLLEHNILALQSKSNMYKDMYGNVIADRLALIGDRDKLKLYNNSLLNSIKQLEAEGRTIFSGNQNDITLEGLNGDSTNTTHDFHGNYGKFIFKFNESSDGYSRILEGYTKYRLDTTNKIFKIYPSYTYITKDELKIRIETYFTKNKDGSYSALAKSSYPNIQITTSGVVFPETIYKNIPTIEYKDKKNISFGIQIGAGLNPIQIYNTGQVPVVMYIGVGIQYELYRLINF